MKRIVFSSIAMLLTLGLFAQPGPKHAGPPPQAERWKRDSIKLQLYVNLTESQLTTVKNTFISFYNGMDALAPKDGTNPPKKEDMDALIQTRRAALKKTLNEQQFDRFETFERAFMPPPPGERGTKMPPPQL